MKKDIIENNNKNKSKEPSLYYPRILTILQKKGISVYRFAQLLETNRKTVAAWVTGQNEPPLEIIERTARILEISIDQVIFQIDQDYRKK